jgi:hypothetical protein
LLTIKWNLKNVANAVNAILNANVNLVDAVNVKIVNVDPNNHL